MGVQPKPFSSSDWTIHSAGPKHAPQIASIHATIFNVPWDENFLKKLLEQRTNISFVATIGGTNEVRGFLLGSLAADEAEILSVGVHKQYQGKGIAQALLFGFIAKVKEKRASSIFLEVSVENSVAQRFYKKSGFKIRGHRKKYYHQNQGTSQDAILLSFSLLEDN